ncbi:hypothetical protein DERF_011476 [Dermatophagoides farinae]|uniref:Uncharacterized protein n=1 Tax=Dermatophagoides farinae TaxID=6954 RepID=A0A922HV16_DERFA|nr:hypothetical protein DERF_011476 [Dermatophagoides farinae]
MYLFGSFFLLDLCGTMEYNGNNNTFGVRIGETPMKQPPSYLSTDVRTRFNLLHFQPIVLNHDCPHLCAIDDYQ